MRKSDREVTDPAEKLAVLLRCDFMTLALAEEEAPYALPLNFGAEVRGGVLYLYFHCARRGKSSIFSAPRQRSAFRRRIFSASSTREWRPAATRPITRASAAGASRASCRRTPNANTPCACSWPTTREKHLRTFPFIRIPSRSPKRWRSAYRNGRANVWSAPEYLF